MTNHECTLTFDSRRDAKKFAEVFAETFSHGYDLGLENPDKSNDVHIYDMTKEQLEWVTKTINSHHFHHFRCGIRRNTGNLRA
jgi:hypothetical protein